MAVWPFGRRSGRPAEATVDKSTTYPTEFIQPIHSVRAPMRKSSKGSSQRPRRRNGSRRTSSRNGDARNLHVSQLAPIQPVSPIGSRFVDRPRTPDSQASTEHITALPQSRELRTSPHLRPATRNDADIPYDFRIYSSSSRLGTPTPPPLTSQQPQPQPAKKQRNRLSRSSSGNKKRYAADLPRKISKKRPNSNPVHEEEIRAMSAPAIVPRPSRRGDSGILRRDSKKVRDGLNRNFERPMSNISLPRADSGPSSKSGAVDGRSYRISVLDIMSPRPVIRVSQPYSMVALGYPSNSSRNSAPRRQAAGKEPAKKSKRVDDLADDLDSSELRAALERDKRRKEQKRERDAEKLKRRLERRVEKERAKEEAADGAAMGSPGAATTAATAGGVVATAVVEQSSPKEEERRPRKSKRSPRKESQSPVMESTERGIVPELEKVETTEPPPPSRAPPARPKSPQRVPPQPTRTPPEPLQSEPVLDLAAVEPPESFAPLESAERREDVHEELEESRPASTRVSPLLPPDGDEIPGLPFLGSVSSGIETPVQSPFASTFNAHLGHHDDAAPPPIIHLDPLNNRENRYSSLSPPTGRNPTYTSASSVTALPQVPGRAEQAQAEPSPKRKRRPSLLSFFRRGDKRKDRNRSASEGDNNRADTGPAFTSLSRDVPVLRVGSVAPTPPNVQSNISVQSSRIASPVRSYSKFREDLPGLNIQRLEHTQLPSPPASRIHSPAPQLSPTSPEHMRGAMITPISAKHISEHSEYEVVPEGERHRSKSPGEMSNPLTHSLASIDSEGSWFTGKRAKRGVSSISGTIRNPASQRTSGSHQEPKQSGQSSPFDGSATPSVNDEYAQQVPVHNFPVELHSDDGRYVQTTDIGGSPSPIGKISSREAIGKTSVYGGRLETDDGSLGKEGAFKVYGDVARQPELKQGVRVKSSEALLKEALAAAVVVDEKLRERDMALRDPDSDDPDTPEAEHPELRRATSVKTRRVLSDDTKLIELSRKASREQIR